MGKNPAEASGGLRRPSNRAPAEFPTPSSSGALPDLARGKPNRAPGGLPARARMEGGTGTFNGRENP